MSTVRAIGPALSWLALIGTMPLPGTDPTVGLIPAMPLSEAGQVIDPSVSVPTARGARPAASAAPQSAHVGVGQPVVHEQCSVGQALRL